MKKITKSKKLFLLNSHLKRSCFIAGILVLHALLLSNSIFAQNKTVTGRVVDDGGKPVQKASVMLKGSTSGTSTNDNGEFQLSVPANGTIVFSAVDFATQELKPGNRTNLNVVLVSVTKNLAEVVVVGYGTQRKEAVTGSVASINGDKIREVPAPNLSQALQGRVAGVEISQTSTRPGATMQIRIRGIRSLSADNNPLIVLDGIPFVGSIADINPDDVKTLDILKDASATAIYGSRGANGVILITTDKGAINRKARITYSAYVGSQKVFAKYPMMNGPQFVALRAAANLYPNNGQDEANDLNTDWQDLFYKTGTVTDHNISVSGGSETGSYNFGMGYYLNQGVIPTQQYKRYSLRGSIDQQVGKYFRLGLTTNNNFNQSEGNQVGLYNALSMSPISTPYNPDGSMKRIIRMAADDQYIFTKNVINNLQDNEQWLNETRGLATYNSVYAEVKAPWVKGLKYRVNLGLDYFQTNNGAYTGMGVGNTNASTVSTASVDNRQTYHWTLENLLTYDHTFSGKHNVNVVALYSAEQNKYTRSNMSGVDIPADAFQFYNLGRAATVTVDPNNQDYRLWGLKSLMGRVMYAYDNRYMLSATVRSDGSSRLAPGHKWHTYPAVSVGWNIANESFMSRFKFIDNLKLRAGFGQTSNQTIDPYSTLGLLSTRPYNFGPSNYATGYYVTQLPNPNLGWEFSKTWNFGLDFSVLNNRLSGTIEYYITKTEDILLNLSLPLTSGVSNIASNIGATQNKGFELSLNGTILKTRSGVTWDAGFNFYTNKNKLVSLASGQDRDEANWWFVGHNINAIFDYKKIGLWQTGDPYLNNLEPGGNVGMIKVEYTGNRNPDGSPVRAIGSADRQIMDVDPKWQGGFNTRVAYKGFDLSIVGIFRHGGILFSSIHGSSGYLNLLSGRRNNLDVDYWTPTNTGAKYPKPGGIISNDNPKYGSTLSYFDASYLKIRTITLGYDLSRSLIKNQAIKMRMYFTVQNPFVMFSPFHKESGLDPETNSYGNQNVASGGAISQNQNLLGRMLIVGYNTPSTRNYIIGVNLSF